MLCQGCFRSRHDKTQIGPTCLQISKLDGVGPVDNRPSTNKLHHFVPKKKFKIKKNYTWDVTRDTWHVTCDMWHVTRDTWHRTHDTWHVTRDTWHVTRLGGVNILSKFQLHSSYRLWFMILWRSGGKGWLIEWIINDDTPGLLIICLFIYFFMFFWN